MNRRTFINAIASGLLTAPSAAMAQPAGKAWRIGLLGSTPPTDPEVAHLLEVFRQTLRGRDYVEGRNVVFEQRFADGKAEPYPALATELVRLNVDVLVVLSSTPAAIAAKNATADIPIVFVGLGDPVGAGLVASLGHPGGNITGVANSAIELNPKRLEFIKIAVPKAVHVLYIDGSLGAFNATYSAANRKKLAVAADSLGLALHRVEMNDSKDLENVAAAIMRERPDAVLLSPAPVVFAARRELAELAIKHRLPAMAFRREAVLAGTLMSYGPSLDDTYRSGAAYVDKIIKGAKPADLPVEQPTTFQLAINVKTAKALGIAIPQSLLLRADEVIQ